MNGIVQNQENFQAKTNVGSKFGMQRSAYHTCSVCGLSEHSLPLPHFFSLNLTMQRWLKLMTHLPTNSFVFPDSVTTRLRSLSLRIGARNWDARSLYLRDLRFPEGTVYTAQPTYTAGASRSAISSRVDCTALYLLSASSHSYSFVQ